MATLLWNKSMLSMRHYVYVTTVNWRFKLVKYKIAYNLLLKNMPLHDIINFNLIVVLLELISPLFFAKQLQTLCTWIIYLHHVTDS